MDGDGLNVSDLEARWVQEGDSALTAIRRQYVGFVDAVPATTS